ncbi:hypothetical protein RvY_09728-1 [Ramazzottius varieornatus]|uniref:DUF4709 domain-containing protein n=1 Tax=Ramazzottius varieornatus TaxID=947166 RepID=A0A1D1VI67_RAMVA|nr:hypothetical protein RvY_09728-1 [Ramazzottius varieornatus]
MAQLNEPSIDVEQLRLDQLYLAVVPSIYLSTLPDGSSPEKKLDQVLNHEASIQHLMNKFRTEQFGFDVAYKTVRDGLAKNRLLVDHATQIFSSDITDLDELFETGHQIVLDLQSMDTEFNQIYELIPVELDRQISELYSKLYNEAMDNIAWQNDRSATYLERLFKYFDQQYQDAVASLLRWWKHYDEMLMVRFERDAMVGNNDVQIMVRTYQKQLRSRNMVLEGLQRDVSCFRSLTEADSMNT